MIEEMEFIRDLVAREGGGDEADYSDLDRFSKTVWEAFRLGLLRKQELAELHSIFGQVFSPLTMHGFAFSKPRGYPDDFEMIDRIYCRYISPDPSLAK